MRNKLYLIVQAAPVYFNVTDYKIQVIRDNTTEEEQIIHHNPHITSFKYEYITYSRPGTYYFKVSFLDPSTGKYCYITKSPVILISSPSNPSIIFGILVLLIGAFSFYTCWKIRKPAVPDTTSPPKLLLVYDPVSSEHLNSMVEVAKYFHNTYSISVMIDVLGIPQSEHKDPVRWYIEAFNEADFVGVFSSPEPKLIQKDAVGKCNIYTNNYSIALAQLGHRLCSLECKSKFFAVKLPKCTWNCLPALAKPLKRYTLPKDLDSLIEMFGISPKITEEGKNFTEALQNSNNKQGTVVLKLQELKSDTNSNPSLYSSSESLEAIVKYEGCCLTLSISDFELDETSENLD